MPRTYDYEHREGMFLFASGAAANLRAGSVRSMSDFEQS